MAALTLYLKNVALGACGSLQNGGSAPATAQTTTGWTVGKIAATPNYAAMTYGSTLATTSFGTTDLQAAGTFAGGGGAGACWRTENQLAGTFASAAWSFAFNVQSTVGTVQAGAIVLRVYSSTDPTGVGAVQRTTAELTGTTATIAATNTTVTSTVSWTPAAFELNDEYLFVQVEWKITTAGASNTANILFEVGSTAAITTSSFTQVLEVPQHFDFWEDDPTEELIFDEGLWDAAPDTRALFPPQPLLDDDTTEDPVYDEGLFGFVPDAVATTNVIQYTLSFFDLQDAVTESVAEPHPLDDATPGRKSLRRR